MFVIRPYSSHKRPKSMEFPPTFPLVWMLFIFSFPAFHKILKLGFLHRGFLPKEVLIQIQAFMTKN
jgi:hypothetical protein